MLLLGIVVEWFFGIVQVLSPWSTLNRSEFVVGLPFPVGSVHLLIVRHE